MEEYDLEEDTVLKSITRVFKARRAAAMRLVELEEDDQGLQQRLRNKVRKRLKRAYGKRQRRTDAWSGGGPMKMRSDWMCQSYQGISCPKFDQKTSGVQNLCKTDLAEPWADLQRG